MPSPGTILQYSIPENRTVRIDDAHLKDGVHIYSNFDPMISKVIAHADSRTGAIKKLVEFLPHYTILGIKTNLSFLGVLIEHPDYIGNTVHTRYLDNHLEQLNQHFIESKDALDKLIPLTAAMLLSLINSNDTGILHQNNSTSEHTANSALWNEIGFWRLSGKINAVLEKQDHVIDQHLLKQNSELIKNGHGYILLLNDDIHDIYMVKAADGSILIRYAGHEFNFNRPDVAPSDETCIAAVKSNKADTGDIVSPMPGRVLSVKVNEGDKVKKGDLLMVIEAMKMENNIMAPYDGVVEKVAVKQGDNVDNSSHLIHLSKEESVKENI
jgi:3-methylcrotonyl-CoA carboxylase alpha subunit